MIDDFELNQSNDVERVEQFKVGICNINNNDDTYGRKSGSSSPPLQARRRSSAMEEDEYYPKSMQEELNEIMEAFYATVSEDDIREYQRFVESVSKKRIAEGAIHPISKAPDFQLEDQDGDIVKLRSLLDKGPVVLVFYRGKWCPHCNAVIMKLQQVLEQIQSKGASLVAISPMLPDGTHYLASKRSLNFPVCSDVGNAVARKFNLTFEVLPDLRDSFLKWGEDIPLHNGDDSWEIPLPATYIIDTNGYVVWSFVDNDPGVRAEPEGR
jgi:peroxiredoxin